MKKIVVAIFFISSMAHAQRAEQAVATVFLAFGVAKSSQYFLESGLWPNEIPDWKDPQTQITGEIVEQCGVLMEGRLLGTNAENLLVLIVKNQKEELKFKPETVEFEFDSGVTRRADVDIDEEFTFKKDTRYVLFIPFPSKGDFKGQNNIKVSAELRDGASKCTAKMEFNRPIDVPPRIATYTRLSSGEFEISYGASSASGEMEKFTKSSNGTYRFDLNFMGVQNGIYFGIGGTNSIPAPDALTVKFGVTYPSPTVSLHSLNLGYIYRHILAQRHFLLVKLGLGSMSLNMRNLGRESVSETAYHQQLSYIYYFAHVNRGFWNGSYAVSFALDHEWVPSKNPDVDFSGSQLGGFVGLRLGN